MFWWFERQGAYTRYEVLGLPDGRYELRIIEADGSERVEHYADADELAKRQRALEGELKANGWTGPHGWVM